MAIAHYPTMHIHLPSHRASVRVLASISLVGASITILVAAFLLLELLFHFSLVTNFLPSTLINFPIFFGLLMTSAITFYERKYSDFQLMPLGIAIFSLGSLIILGHFFTDANYSFFVGINIYAGLNFFLMGLFPIINLSHIPRRFYYAQLLIFVALFINLFGLLESMYQLISGMQQNVVQTFLSAFLFSLMCLSLVFSKPDRGFMTLLTTDSHSSKLARMSLLSFAILSPILGIFILFIEKMGFFDENGRLALIIVLFLVFSFIITWINVKRLYPSEIEHYLIKEAIRVNNITLELNASDLSTKVNQLEQDKREVADKLNNQQTLKDLMDNT